MIHITTPDTIDELTSITTTQWYSVRREKNYQIVNKFTNVHEKKKIYPILKPK